MAQFSLQERSTPSTILRLAAKPDGYGATGWALPTRAGAIAARNRSVGAAVFTGAMASGRALTGAFVGVASFSGTGALVVSGTGAFFWRSRIFRQYCCGLGGERFFAATSSFSGAVVAQVLFPAPLLVQLISWRLGMRQDRFLDRSPSGNAGGGWILVLSAR